MVLILLDFNALSMIVPHDAQEDEHALREPSSPSRGTGMAGEQAIRTHIYQVI